jgi:hypothetical protein
MDRLAVTWLGAGAVLFDCAIDYQQNHGPDHGSEEACRLARLIEPQGLAAVGGGNGTADADQDGHDPAHAVIAGFEEACNQAHDQADKDGADNAHAEALRSGNRVCR